MKNIYIPTEEELFKMQKYGANIYKYLTVKAIEGIIMDGIKYQPKGKLKGQFNYVKMNPDIARGVCLLYPEEIEYSPVAKMDFDLCKSIIFQERNNETLDDIRGFDNVLLNNRIILGYIIDKLYDILKTNPRYRYDYAYENKILDEIFSKKIDIKQVYKNETLEKLFSIEPAYVLDLGSNIPYGIIERYLNDAIDIYSSRYNIDNSFGEEYIGKDILTIKNEDVKRLIRTMKQD